MVAAKGMSTVISAQPCARLQRTQRVRCSAMKQSDVEVCVLIEGCVVECSGFMVIRI